MAGEPGAPDKLAIGDVLTHIPDPSLPIRIGKVVAHVLNAYYLVDDGAGFVFYASVNMEGVTWLRGRHDLELSISLRAMVAAQMLRR